MSDTSFDPKSLFDTYRSAFEPAIKAQQQGVKTLDRAGRYQYDVAGDFLEWGLAQANAALAAHTPAEFVSKQVELTTALGEKLRARAQEFVSLATDAQSSFVESAQPAVKAATEAGKAAAGTIKAGVQTTAARAAAAQTTAVQAAAVRTTVARAAAAQPRTAQTKKKGGRKI